MSATIDRDDIATLTKIQTAILDRDTPQVGDYVDLGHAHNGNHRIRRIAHLWQWEDTNPNDWDYQPTGTLGDGSFHYSHDYASYSGGLDPAQPLNQLRRKTDGELRPARGWIWHHGTHRAHNGVTVTVYVPVWEVTP